MKHKIFSASLFVSVSIVLLSFFQNPFAYTLRVMDPATGQPASMLEKLTATLQKGKSKSSTATAYTISGAKSSIRLKIPKIAFEINSDKSTSSMNPADYLVLYKLTTEKNNRSFLTGESLIPVDFSFVDGAGYRAVPSSGLIPGEYAFIDKSTTAADGSFTVWAFGVDQ